jgi:aromatic-L-amino-acid decarboxylase
MDNNEFRKQGHRFVDWMADYYQQVESMPVKPDTAPGDIYRQIPVDPPEKSEEMDHIFNDFRSIVLPGMTHWQSPNFFAYFPANSSYPSVLAEMLTATLGAQCMVWETSPAAAELEERMLNWLRTMTGLPKNMVGVIQDTASTATLVSLLSAREKHSRFVANKRGLHGLNRYRIYGSTETHSSIEKAVKIAGFGSDNLVKVGVDELYRMDISQLEMAIENDLQQGFTPLAVVATLGTTGPTSMDPLAGIAKVCGKRDLWLHVDAAMAGTLLVLPEYRNLIDGIGQVDSFVFNPHKWMFTNFDCSAYYVKDKELLISTFEILPEYLKTPTRGVVNDYRDWGVPLGRRFRALKLWFVLRSFGVEGISVLIRKHINLAKDQASIINEHPDFELMAPLTMNTICFRYNPGNMVVDELNRANETLMYRLNKSGKMLFSHTRLKEQYTIRWVIGQTRVEREHLDNAWEQILNYASKS